ncbi:MAG TPA: nucleoside monophosphate kinase [Planctomycetota bacterium]|nr:nucleoside monophosphate kinase [Planctomycetota bacterium]
MVRVVLVTCPPERASEIAGHLLTQRVCACVNILPSITSRYWWEGRLESAEESLLIIKCDAAQVDAVVAQVKEVHPYEVPEVVALPVDGGNRDYLDWVRSAPRTGGAAPKPSPDAQPAVPASTPAPAPAQDDSPFAALEEIDRAFTPAVGANTMVMVAAGAVPAPKPGRVQSLSPSEAFRQILGSVPEPSAEVRARAGRLRIVLIGPPGAGKGTQAKLLAARYGLRHISPGDIILKAVRGGTEFGRRAQEYTKAGRLVPDEEVNALVQQYLGALGESGCVLDGFPRTLAQAESLAATMKPDCVFYINAPQEVLIDRLTKRSYCDCGAAYGPARPPAKAGVCDVCGGKLFQRDDDQPRHVLTRLDEYNSKTRELLRFYRDRLRPVDASQTMGDIFRQLCKLLEK